jgi:hypothetical protein
MGYNPYYYYLCRHSQSVSYKYVSDCMWCMKYVDFVQREQGDQHPFIAIEHGIYAYN